MMDERRRARRKRVDLMLNAYQNGFPRLAVADNLSETGIRLRRVLQPSGLKCGPVELEFRTTLKCFTSRATLCTRHRPAATLGYGFST